MDVMLQLWAYIFCVFLYNRLESSLYQINSIFRKVITYCPAVTFGSLMCPSITRQRWLVYKGLCSHYQVEKSQNLLRTVAKCWGTLCHCEENANDCQSRDDIPSHNPLVRRKALLWGVMGYQVCIWVGIVELRLWNDSTHGKLMCWY